MRSPLARSPRSWRTEHDRTLEIVSISFENRQVERAPLERRPRTRGKNTHPGAAAEVESSWPGRPRTLTMRPTTTPAAPPPGPTAVGRTGGVSKMTANSNKQSNAGMDATHFPDDLVQTQAAWNATYAALAAPHRRDVTALRRRLLRLSVRMWWHPYWETVPSVPAARSELRQTTRARRADRAAPPGRRPGPVAWFVGCRPPSRHPAIPPSRRRAASPCSPWPRALSRRVRLPLSGRAASPLFRPARVRPPRPVLRPRARRRARPSAPPPAIASPGCPARRLPRCPAADALTGAVRPPRRPAAAIRPGLVSLALPPALPPSLPCRRVRCRAAARLLPDRTARPLSPLRAPLFGPIPVFPAVPSRPGRAWQRSCRRCSAGPYPAAGPFRRVRPALPLPSGASCC